MSKLREAYRAKRDAQERYAATPEEDRKYTSPDERERKPRTLMDVDIHNITKGHHAVRILPLRPEHLGYHPSPFVQAKYHMISVISNGAPRRIQVMSLKHFKGDRALDPFDLERWRGFKRLNTSEERRAWIQDPANDWLAEKKSHYAFHLLQREEDGQFVPLEEADLRVTNFKWSVVKVADTIPAHRRKPILFSDPWEGTLLYIERTEEENVEARFGTRYNLEWENQPFPFFDDDRRMEEFLADLPDLYRYKTEEYHLTSEDDCRYFSPTQVGDMMRGRLEMEEAIKQNIEKFKKGEPIISEREMEWMVAYHDRLRNQNNADPFPLRDFGKTSVAVSNDPPQNRYQAPPPPPEQDTPMRRQQFSPQGRKTRTLPNGGYQSPIPPPPPEDDDVPF